jgi:hypothetical protein
MLLNQFQKQGNRKPWQQMCYFIYYSIRNMFNLYIFIKIIIIIII